jgi:hypothetical protein
MTSPEQTGLPIVSARMMSRAASCSSGGGACGAVLQDPHVVVELEAVTGGPQHAHVGVDAGDKQCLHPEAAQYQVQVGP